jgi:hypothetical protein
MSLARTRPYTREVTIFGNAVHLLVDAEVTDGDIERDLEAGAQAAVDVRPITASLEDVFVRLTRLQSEPPLLSQRVLRGGSGEEGRGGEGPREGQP